MRLIGITGGIGAGKTEVLSFIRQHYLCKICLADEVAHIIQSPGQDCYVKMVALLGKGVLDADGRINKNRMAAQIFLDKSLLKKVNDIVHPAVRTYLEQEVKKAAKEGKTELFFIEAALLIENGYKDFVDEMWYVYASPEVSRRRLKVNRGYSDEKITGIMGNQLTEEQYRKNSDFVIDNSDSLGTACEQIKNRLEAYTWQE